MPLHIDYRPESLDEFIGNSKTARNLRTILNNKNRPHVFLFQGPSGCGKTTLARITAKELGCAHHDLVEINASNNRGIETAREIVMNIRFLPTVGETRVYILDEAHQTTKDFQNAMLKILEEPPSHVYFMLCTTEPEKLLKTVRTRCATFAVGFLDEKRLTKILWRTAKKAKLSVENISTIVEVSGGCPREALIMLEMFSEGGEPEPSRHRKQVIDLCRAIWQGEKWIKLADILKDLEDEPERVRMAVLGYCNTILLSKDYPRAALIMEHFNAPLYNTGKPGLTLMVYNAWSEING